MRGHISREFTAWCGCCERFDQRQAPTMSEFIVDIRKSGWRLSVSDGWRCPWCVKKFDEHRPRRRGVIRNQT